MGRMQGTRTRGASGIPKQIAMWFWLLGLLGFKFSAWPGSGNFLFSLSADNVPLLYHLIARSRFLVFLPFLVSPCSIISILPGSFSSIDPLSRAGRE